MANTHVYHYIVIIQSAMKIVWMMKNICFIGGLVQQKLNSIANDYTSSFLH